jgi:hypothetical protein
MSWISRKRLNVERGPRLVCRSLIRFLVAACLIAVTSPPIAAADDRDDRMAELELAEARSNIGLLQKTVDSWGAELEAIRKTPNATALVASPNPAPIVQRRPVEHPASNRLERRLLETNGQNPDGSTESVRDSTCALLSSRSCSRKDSVWRGAHLLLQST